MKLFVTGISGFLGLNLALQLKDLFTVSGAFHSHPVVVQGVDSVRWDLTSFTNVEAVLSSHAPDVIVHTAGLTNVDECETNPELARELNVMSAYNVATVANTLGARLVHISTDHLFNGEEAWRTEDARPQPLNAYASTKWQAEQTVQKTCPNSLIIRTNFYGWGSSVKASFSDWILQSLEHQRELPMFSDVFFTPILVNDLIDVMIKMIGLEISGIFHVVGSERLSKYDFGMQTAEGFGYSTDRIHPTKLAELESSVNRPYDMSLSSAKIGSHLNVKMPDVAHGLRRLKRLRNEGWDRAMWKAHRPEPGLGN